MKLFIFLVISILSFAQTSDINAKTQENRQKLMELYTNANTEYKTFKTYQNNLWYEDEKFARELLDKVPENKIDDVLGYIKNKNVLNDKELFLKLMKKNEYLLFYAGKILKNDKELVLIALRRNIDAFKYVNKRFRDDKDVILKFIERGSNTLKYTSERLKDDEEVVLKSIEPIHSKIKPHVYALRYASLRLQQDKPFIFKIMRKNILALAHIDKYLLKDKEIVSYYLKELREFDAFNQYNLNDHHSIFKKIDPSFLSDEKMMYQAVSALGISLQYGSPKIIQNKKIVKQAVSKDGLALQYVDKSLQKDKEVIILALRNNPKALDYVPVSMRKDKEILKALKDKNSNFYLKNKIKRKIKPLAWESYDINETLELLYGQDRVYEKSKDIKITIPLTTDDYFDSKPFEITTKHKVKSIAILQVEQNKRALTALYYPYDNSIKIRLPRLKILNASLSIVREGRKVIVVIETKDNQLFIETFLIKHRYYCDNGYGNMHYYLEDLKKYIENLKTKSKKYTYMKYGISKKKWNFVKFRHYSPMVSYEEAEILNEKVNFISHINGSTKDEKIFDLYLSEYISQKPLITMGISKIHKNKDINFTYTTINGEVTFKVLKPKKSKKK